MKLEPNMYVRDTRNGTISKQTDFSLDFRPQKTTYDFEKASYNIIDLIEVGDYVNGYKVVSKGTLSSESNNVYLEILTKNLKNFWNNKIFEQDIKTILTHEQFENNCFRIGDE